MEVSVVLAVVGILAAMAVGALQDHRCTAAERNAAVGLSRSLRDARQLAIGLGRPVTVRFLPDRLQTILWDDADADGGFDAGEAVTTFARRPVTDWVDGCGDYRDAVLRPRPVAGNCHSCDHPDRIATFMPLHGALVDPGRTLCGLDLELHAPGVDRVVARVDMTPAGALRATGTP